eukprot:TRINITY_DN3427_c0_g4_i1.p1 TRINITY_DN3427_c0_g4~~TRINITY_DN3427_c0_g4_i1.p1  ORF type:complete len:104 (-),score=18.15 TRINITY_DN3427_c0_g4_i1:89-400(-)
MVRFRDCWNGCNFMMNGKAMTTAVDIYSFGILVWQVVMRRNIGSGIKDKGIILERTFLRALLTLPSSSRQVFRDLVLDCTTENPLNRPSAQSIAKMFENDANT